MRPYSSDRYKSIVLSIIALAVTPGFAVPTPEPDAVTAIISALGAVVIGATGWIAAYIRNRHRDNRAKQIQLTFEYTSAQLREFYLPLTALIDQVITTEETDRPRGYNPAPAQEHKVTGSFYCNYLRPLHQEITQVLKTKSHLIRSDEHDRFPNWFIKYFAYYAAAEKAFLDLAARHLDNESTITVPPFPDDFSCPFQGWRFVAMASHIADPSRAGIGLWNANIGL